MDLPGERSALILTKRASADKATGENIPAIADLSEALEIVPNRSALHLMRISINQRFGEHEAARRGYATIKILGNAGELMQAERIIAAEPNF